MKIEHIGFLVDNPISMGNWWAANLDFKILRQLGNDEDGVTFIKDNGNTILEFGKIITKETFNFNKIKPLQIHIAIECENPEMESRRLIKNGAKLIGESQRTEYKGEMILIRDPFGAVIQLINRKNKLE
jgi:hypothetical protein